MRTYRARQPQKRTPKNTFRTTEEPGDQRTEIQLRVPGKSFALAPTAQEQFSFYWSYIVRSRGRWQENEHAHLRVAEEALELFDQVGISREVIEQIGNSDVVEIALPYAEEEGGWAARLLPWEFLLHEVTRKRRAGRPLTVVRHLHSTRPRAVNNAPQVALFVKNGAGPIGDEYTFEDELSWMSSQLQLEPDFLPNPTRRLLADRVALKRPDVIHLTGVDLHEAVSLAFVDKQDDPDVDGLLMAGSEVIEEVTHADLAEALNPRGYPGARLIAFNFHNSSARIAAAAVNRGARAAIAFQDRIDDDVAERFFAAFYREWRTQNWDLLGAFKTALHSSGAGVVLWSAESLLAAPRAQSNVKTSVQKAKRGASETSKPSDTVMNRSVHELIGVRVQTPKSINYSLMHGGKRVFSTFTLYRKAEGVLPPIKVEVALQTGTENLSFRKTVRMDTSQLSLSEEIHVPLTSSALRAVREMTRAGLFYRVSCGNEDIVCETAEIVLCPIDEWKWDPKDDSQWLGAFVLPRDPAVLAIVDVAQKYLQALRDDSGVGFDGYQSFDPDEEDPWLGVEMQVRALWSTLAFEMSIAYVNPPPVFSEQSQRLRSPGEVVRGKRGTCIDLALLLAACLEYLDIHPVIFVLKDHAFPGFWRSNQAYEDFVSLKDVRAESVPGGSSAAVNTFATYDEALRLVRSGNLVPLETVLLTRRLSFREAIEQGMENLNDPRNFGALLDVHSSRRHVTPLPMLGVAS
jgi:hypothetical protein